MSAPEGLNENHRRILVIALAHVDGLLREIETAAAAGDSPSLFPKYIPDVTPQQRKVIAGHIAVIRAKLVESLDRLGLTPPEPSVRASWGIVTSLDYALVAVEDSAPSRIRGYGEVGPQAATLLESVEADLMTALQHFRRYIMQPAE